MKGARMKSLIGKRVMVTWTRSFKNLEGTVEEVEEHMVFLTKVKDAVMKDTVMDCEQSDQWINTRCETFQKLVILEEKAS